jgi:subfamily B ATP-binding cassette protein MsbA
LTWENPPAPGRARATARIHSQVLGLSFACASGTKVGDLTDDASQGPEAIRIQIEQSGQLLVLLLLSGTVLAVLVGISPWLLLAVALVGGASRYGGEPGLASP